MFHRFNWDLRLPGSLEQKGRERFLGSIRSYCLGAVDDDGVNKGLVQKLSYIVY